MPDNGICQIIKILLIQNAIEFIIGINLGDLRFALNLDKCIFRLVFNLSKSDYLERSIEDCIN